MKDLWDSQTSLMSMVRTLWKGEQRNVYLYCGQRSGSTIMALTLALHERATLVTFDHQRIKKDYTTDSITVYAPREVGEMLDSEIRNLPSPVIFDGGYVAPMSRAIGVVAACEKHMLVIGAHWDDAPLSARLNTLRYATWELNKLLTADDFKSIYDQSGTAMRDYGAYKPRFYDEREACEAAAKSAGFVQ